MKRSPLFLHTATLLRFYVRSRLILAFTIIVFAVWALDLVPLFLFESPAGRFETLKNVAVQTHGFVWFATAGLGLFAMWAHSAQRSAALVFTRPGRPESWVGAVFVSAFIVAVVAHAAAALLTLALSLAWHVPFQAGFIWQTADAMFESIIIVSALTGLAAALHPVIAVIAFAVFNEGVFYSLDLMLLGYLQGRPAGLWPRAAEWFARGIHEAVPMLDPFGDKTAAVASSLRVTSADWGYLAATGAYAALAFVFFFSFAGLVLRRRPAV
jgi:hypothetical protein